MPLILRLRLFGELTKFTLSTAVTTSLLFAYLLAGGSDPAKLSLLLLAVLLLALGVSALNQYQERQSDALMERTRHRPLPSGRISPTFALLLSTSLILFATLMGTTLLGLSGLLLFLFVPFWYNGFYTYYKHRWAFTVIPGGLLGVVPIALGWLGAGESLLNSHFLGIALLMFVWQVPHFWLLAIKFGKDYRAAACPMPTDIMSETLFLTLLRGWWIATIFCSFAVTMLYLPELNTLWTISIFLALLMIYIAIKYISIPVTPHKASTLFHILNLYLLSVLILLSIHKFVYTMP